MDAEGCTVHFLCFRHQYSWDELVTKRKEDYGNRVTYKSPYDKAVIFSTRNLKKTAWMKQRNICLFHFTLLSSLFISFLRIRGYIPID